MSFNTLDFLLLFAVTTILYYIFPHRFRNYILLLASFDFYGAHSPKMLLYLVFIILITYIIAFLIEDRRSISRLLLIAGIMADSAILIYYKYSAVFFRYVSDLLSVENGFQISPAPLGISFITFSTISYIVDVYRGKCEAERDIIKYALYVSFFPKVLQGPIEKAGDILSQFDDEHHFDIRNYRIGMLMVLYGLFLKMVIADTAAVAVEEVYRNPVNYSGAANLTATILFAVQLYCDFAGYSYTAIGVARVLGFTFKQNFRQPYLSVSVSEFWKRWHMSLNRWLTEYIYIPLGGSRCSRFRKYFNVMTTFVISGLWHGTGSGYFVWGFLNGLYIVAGNEIRYLKDKLLPKKDQENSDQPAVMTHLNRLLGRAFMTILILFSWIFFRAVSVKKAAIIIKRIILNFNFKGFLNYAVTQMEKGSGTLLFGLDAVHDIPILLACILIVGLIDLFADWRFRNGKPSIAEALADGNRVLRWAVSFILIFAILILGAYGYGYLASSFIYEGF